MFYVWFVKNEKKRKPFFKYQKPFFKYRQIDYFVSKTRSPCKFLHVFSPPSDIYLWYIGKRRCFWYVVLEMHIELNKWVKKSMLFFLFCDANALCKIAKKGRWRDCNVDGFCCYRCCCCRERMNEWTNEWRGWTFLPPNITTTTTIIVIMIIRIIVILLLLLLHLGLFQVLLFFPFHFPIFYFHVSMSC